MNQLDYLNPKTPSKVREKELEIKKTRAAVLTSPRCFIKTKKIGLSLSSEIIGRQGSLLSPDDKDANHYRRVQKDKDGDEHKENIQNKLEKNFSDPNVNEEINSTHKKIIRKVWPLIMHKPEKFFLFIVTGNLAVDNAELAEAKEVCQRFDHG